jgi:hypothetical protein
MRTSSKTALKLIFSISTSLHFTCSSAFWGFGHIFVARVAFDKLNSTIEGRKALEKAN